MDGIEFDWDKKSTTLEYSINSVTKKVNLVLKGDYICLGTKNTREAHAEAVEILLRIDDGSRKEKFNHDWEKYKSHIEEMEESIVKKFWFPISCWSSYGKRLVDEAAFRGTLLAQILKCLVENGKKIEKSKRDDWEDEDAVATASLQYALLWEQLLVGAKEFSDDRTQNAASNNAVVGRFFSVPDNTPELAPRPFKLFLVIPAKNKGWLTPNLLINECKKVKNIVESKCADITPVSLQDFITEKNVTVPRNPPQCRFIVASEEEYNLLSPGLQLVEISKHPLDFYKTYVQNQPPHDLGMLVDLQVKPSQNTPGSWLRTLPTLMDVRARNNTIVSNSGTEKNFRKKLDAIGPETKTDMILQPGDKVGKDNKEKTEAIMGGSANKWARQTLQWAGRQGEEKPVVAEWLHRGAHRFSGNEGDDFQNLCFGSKECNTHMIRAENVVNDLLKHTRSVKYISLYTVLTTARTVKMLERDGTEHEVSVLWTVNNDDEFFYWIGSELHYNIKVVTTAGARLGKTIFKPFHRYRPFRYEVELDKLVLDNLYFKNGVHKGIA